MRRRGTEDGRSTELSSLQRRREAPRSPDKPLQRLRPLGIVLLIASLGILYMPWATACLARWQNDYLALGISLVPVAVVGYHALIGHLYAPQCRRDERDNNQRWVGLFKRRKSQ